MKYIYVLKKDQNGLIFLDFIKISPEYSDMQLNAQNFQNALNALDTKVDNAISGGSMLPAKTSNILLQPFTNSVAGRPYSFLSNTATQVKIGIDYEKETMNSLTRTFTGINWKIYNGDKFTYNYTYSYRGGNTTYEAHLLCSDGTNISIPSFSGSIDISQFAGKTISSAVFYGTGKENISFNFATLLLQNKKAQ